MTEKCYFEPVCRGLCIISMYNNVTCKFIKGMTPIINIKEFNFWKCREEALRMRNEIKEFLE